MKIFKGGTSTANWGVSSKETELRDPKVKIFFFDRSFRNIPIINVLQWIAVFFRWHCQRSTDFKFIRMVSRILLFVYVNILPRTGWLQLIYQTPTRSSFFPSWTFHRPRWNLLFLGPQQKLQADSWFSLLFSRYKKSRVVQIKSASLREGP